MLQFDSRGYLSPYQNIISDIDELEDVFKTNENRGALFASFLSYTAGLKDILGQDLNIWVDGSFVTKKENPKDIDIVTFVEHDLFERFEDELKDFFYPLSKSKYNIDAYIVVVYPEGHKKNFFFKSDYAHWLQDFSKDLKMNCKKGFLEVVI